MARDGTKTGGRNFKPGNKMGKGAPKISPELKAARKLTRTVLEDILNRFIHMTKDEMREAKRAPERTFLELIVISVLDKAEGWGDTSRLNFVLNRLLGESPLEVNIKNTTALTPEQRAARIALLMANKEKANGNSGR